MLLTLIPLLAITTLASTTPSLIPRQASNTTKPPCKLPQWTMTNFWWFNSTSNLDCDRRSHDRSHDSTDIRDAITQSLCMTGLSSQPPGYGPPDVLSLEISDIGRCRQRNPGSVPPRSIGKGWIRCGGSAPNVFFEGSSNEAENVATIRVKDEFYCEGNREEGDGRLRVYTANGKIEFGIVCTRDEGRNATCVGKEKSVSIPVTDWAVGSGRWVVGEEWE